MALAESIALKVETDALLWVKRRRDLGPECHSRLRTDSKGRRNRGDHRLRDDGG
jgi:hypothetical protein